MHARVVSADGALRITPYLDLPKLHLERIDQHQSSDQRVTHSEDPLDRLERLQAAHQAREHAEHTGLGAVGHQVRRRRLRKETSIARPAGRSEHRDLAVEPEDAAVHVWLSQQDRRVVHQVSGREVIAPVEGKIVAAQDLERVFRGEPDRVGHDLNIGIQVPQPFLRGFSLGAPEASGSVEDLALQVGELDQVGVHDPQGSNARGRQVEGGRRAEAAGADDEYPGATKPLLSRDADFRQGEVSGVANQLGGGERRHGGNQ